MQSQATLFPIKINTFVYRAQFDEKILNARRINIDSVCYSNELRINLDVNFFSSPSPIFFTTDITPQINIFPNICWPFYFQVFFFFDIVYCEDKFGFISRLNSFFIDFIDFVLTGDI